jgi:hypothetical protein
MLQLKKGGSVTCAMPASDHKSRINKVDVFNVLNFMIRIDNVY